MGELSEAKETGKLHKSLRGRTKADSGHANVRTRVCFWGKGGRYTWADSLFALKGEREGLSVRP